MFITNNSMNNAVAQQNNHGNIQEAASITNNLNKKELIGKIGNKLANQQKNIQSTQLPNSTATSSYAKFEYLIQSSLPHMIKKSILKRNDLTLEGLEKYINSKQTAFQIPEFLRPTLTQLATIGKVADVNASELGDHLNQLVVLRQKVLKRIEKELSQQKLPGRKMLQYAPPEHISMGVDILEVLQIEIEQNIARILNETPNAEFPISTASPEGKVLWKQIVNGKKPFKCKLKGESRIRALSEFAILLSTKAGTEILSTINTYSDLGNKMSAGTTAGAAVKPLDENAAKRNVGLQNGNPNTDATNDERLVGSAAELQFRTGGRRHPIVVWANPERTSVTMATSEILTYHELYHLLDANMGLRQAHQTDLIKQQGGDLKAWDNDDEYRAIQGEGKLRLEVGLRQRFYHEGVPLKLHAQVPSIEDVFHALKA